MQDPTELCVRVSQEIFGDANVDLADELISVDFVDYEAPAGTPVGPESIKRTVRWIHASIGDITYHVDDSFGEGDRVALRMTMSGRHDGELMGRPATGRRFSVNQLHIVRITDSKIAEHWAARDDAGMMRQLGFLD